MYVSINTQYTYDVQAHATAQEAVAHLLNNLDSDYHDDFWASEDGTKIKRGRRMVGFDLVVYNSAADVIRAVIDLELDSEYLPTVLRAIATAIENGIQRGLDAPNPDKINAII